MYGQRRRLREHQTGFPETPFRSGLLCCVCRNRLRVKLLDHMVVNLKLCNNAGEMLKPERVPPLLQRILLSTPLSPYSVEIGSGNHFLSCFLILCIQLYKVLLCCSTFHLEPIFLVAGFVGEGIEGITRCACGLNCQSNCLTNLDTYMSRIGNYSSLEASRRYSRRFETREGFLICVPGHPGFMNPPSGLVNFLCKICLCVD